MVHWIFYINSMYKLSQHPMNNRSEYKVAVSSSLENEILRCDFSVSAPKLNTNSSFVLENWSNWELWKYDVVEVFLSRDSQKNRYLELQISPENQKLALIIEKPRTIFKLLPQFSATAFAEVTNGGFNASFAIPIDLIPGEDEVIRGNYCACLGPSEKQSFFSLVEHVVDKPDFHLPQNFKELHKI